jgi:hypothetical protein
VKEGEKLIKRAILFLGVVVGTAVDVAVWVIGFASILGWFPS